MRRRYNARTQLSYNYHHDVRYPLLYNKRIIKYNVYTIQLRLTSNDLPYDMGTSGFVPFCLAAVLKFVIIDAVSAGKYPEIHQAEFRIGAPANFKYTGHVYRKISASSRLKCAASCLRSGATCASFNYCGSTKLCEFNNATVSNYPGHMKSADGCLYFDILFGKNMF